jgi:hypothetical protein
MPTKQPSRVIGKLGNLTFTLQKCHCCAKKRMTQILLDATLFSTSRRRFRSQHPRDAWSGQTLLIGHVKLFCLLPLRRAVKSAIVTLTSCDNMPSFKCAAVWCSFLARSSHRAFHAWARQGTESILRSGQGAAQWGRALPVLEHPGI